MEESIQVMSKWLKSFRSFICEGTMLKRIANEGFGSIYPHLAGMFKVALCCEDTMFWVDISCDKMHMEDAEYEGLKKRILKSIKKKGRGCIGYDKEKYNPYQHWQAICSIIYDEVTIELDFSMAMSIVVINALSSIHEDSGSLDHSLETTLVEQFQKANNGRFPTLSDFTFENMFLNSKTPFQKFIESLSAAIEEERQEEFQGCFLGIVTDFLQGHDFGTFDNGNTTDLAQRYRTIIPIFSLYDQSLLSLDK